MTVIFGIVALLSYAFTVLAVMSAGGPDVQWVLTAGVFATCGTVAMAGGAICERLDALKKAAS